MLNAYWRDNTLGSGTDAWKYWAERCAGNLCEEQWQEIENCIARSAGTCMTMGTASTMACIAEALGFTLPGASSIPAVVSEHSRLAVASGRLAVESAWTNRKPSSLLTQGSFINAMITQLTIGGSTNAIVHIIALAGRAGIRITLEDFDTWSRKVPILANIRPSGKFLMEDFHRAGGLRSLWTQLTDLLDLSGRQINGKTLGDSLDQARIIHQDVIRLRSNPIVEHAGTCVLKGNLAPNGCVIKSSATDGQLLEHRGPAVVFENYPDLKKRIHDPELDVTPDSVLVLKDAGPSGAPGFPEWGMLPIPEKLLKQGVRDMVRISDARMSGTSYGTCVLHVSPESRLGGPLAWVKTGDVIELNVPARRITLLISDEELQARKKDWVPPREHASRGYTWLYTKHVTQADRGCDFDFLEGGDYGKEPDIF
jgi:dihydroxy-acid dehydratase